MDAFGYGSTRSLLGIVPNLLGIQWEHHSIAYERNERAFCCNRRADASLCVPDSCPQTPFNLERVGPLTHGLPQMDALRTCME